MGFFEAEKRVETQEIADLSHLSLRMSGKLEMVP